MFETIAVNGEHVIGVRVTGTLTDADYKAFLPVLEELIEKKGPVSLYIDMEDFQGWEAKAAWDDLRFGLAHDVDFRRIAVVGGPKWVQWMLKLSALFFSAEIRYFTPDEKEKALAWLNESDEAQKDACLEPEPEPELHPYKNILLATDFSPHAGLAGRRAREIADKYQARLRLIHVFDDIALYDDLYEPLIEERFLLQQTLQEAAQEQLSRLAEQLGITEEKDVQLLLGPPKATILDFAREQNIDLIVLGSHGRRGIERLLGSVAAGVVNSAPCDVLTVRLEENG